MSLTYRVITIMTVLSIVLTANLYADDPFNTLPWMFTKADVSPNLLYGESARVYSVLTNTPTTKSIAFVNLTDNLHSQRGFRLLYMVDMEDGKTHRDEDDVIITRSLIIPEAGKHSNLSDSNVQRLIVRRERIDIISLDDREYAWVGNVYRDEMLADQVGDVTIINRNGVVTIGSIQVYGDFYQIHSLGNEIHALVIYDHSKIPRSTETDVLRSSCNSSSVNKINIEGVAAFSSTNQDGEMVSLSSKPRCLPNYTRALVIYTQGAANSVSDINATISVSIQETNEAYFNSHINNLRIAVAQRQQVSISLSGNINNDLNTLINNSQIQQLRNQYNADIVILLTQEIYGNIRGAVLDLLPSEDEAYAIVVARHSTGPTYTFAHEVGHIMGAHHHPDDPGPINDKFNYGYGHKFFVCDFWFIGCLWGTRYSTVVAYDWDLQGREYTNIKYYSNPNIKYRGESTGQILRDNARVNRETAHIVSDYRDPNELRTSIYAYPGNAPGEYTFTADPCGGIGSYSYEWRISYGDPFNYGQIVSTASSFTTLLPSGDNYVKLTVYTSSGQEAVSVRYIWVTDPGCEPWIICEPHSIAEKPEDYDKSSDISAAVVTDFKIYPPFPNPFNPSTEIRFTLPVDVHVTLTVYDLLGREVARLVDTYLNANIHQVSFNASHLPSGSYIIRMQAGNFISYQRVLLMK